jgi:hypothetical protein
VPALAEVRPARTLEEAEDRAMRDHVKPRPFTLEELRAYLVEIFPEFWKDGDFRVEDIAPMSATVRLIHHPRRAWALITLDYYSVI